MKKWSLKFLSLPILIGIEILTGILLLVALIWQLQTINTG